MLLRTVVIAALLALACEPTQRGPFLMIREPSANSSVVMADEEGDGSEAAGQAVTIGLDVLPEAAVLKLAQFLEGLRARANPLFIAIDDEAQIGELETILRPQLPSLNAARAIANTFWQLPGGPEVSLVASCPEDAAETNCIPVWGRLPKTALERRARLAAWPVAFAILLRVSDPATIGALRSRISARQGTVALVIDGQSTLLETDAVAMLRATARKLLPYVDHADPEQRPWMRALAFPYTGKEIRNLLALERNEVLIVPRLGALARPDKFKEEVTSALERLQLAEKVEWLEQPPG